MPPALDTGVPAVLLRTDRNVMHHGALGVVRSLGARGVAVHAVVEHPWTPLARSRYLHRRWPWAVGRDAVLARLEEIATALGRPAVLLTTDDGGATLLAEHGDALRDRYLFPRVPAELPRRLADKAALPVLCAEHGMPCPRTEPAATAEQVAAFAAETGLPVVVKRATAWDGPGRPSTSLVRTPAELETLAAEVTAHPGSLLLQEYLAPLDSGPQDWFVHAYLDGSGTAVFVGTGVKERSYPAHAGLTSLGRVEPWPELAATATGFLRRAGYRGVVDLDLRVDPVDGVAKLLDANPRPGAQFRMFRGARGTDVAVAAHLDLTGRPVPDDPPGPRRFLVEPYDPLSAIAHARRGELGARAWAASMRGVDEPAWFAADDPLPFALMTARTTATALGRAARRAPHPPPTPTSTTPLDPREEPTMSERTDVVVIGAGPYGLSLGAHLAATGLRVRQFGRVMQAWKTMPKGMYLKSQGHASSLSDPDGTHGLQAYCARTETPYADYGLPVALDTFIAYGEWFARERVPGVEEVPVVGLTADTGGFRVELGDGEVVQATQVVVATGITGAAAMPPELAELPARLASHTSDQADLADFSGRRVVVLGAGQSALESAALLHESGADTRIVARERRIAWNGDPLAAQRSVWRRIREPEAPLGSGWGTWFYSTQPDLFRRLPAGTRLTRARTALGPAGAYWLRPRVEGVIPTLLGHRVESAGTDGDEVRLDLRDTEGRRHVLHADHVLAGTGYRIDLSRIGFLDPSLIARVDTLGGTPSVTAEYESSVPGLFFCGPAVAPSLGPVMRFAYGSAHAAVACTRGLTASLPAPVSARARG
ncbi:NAD(P)-binding domain-containing protein [Actinomycetospora endophytica]|uniref:NAD(P)-binding domain-containing protein n=1 Tax=Actinomycetospora endophytica TaxID=2291215 RepID=A0ABS8PCF6_9PSEU|nr:FAD-dependent oxidoreductase [Actinomycetospora endophytica]MCD2195931.1 NAD(P)-binding domain-containing protein [Actinomycetospora endophytica]